MKGRSLEGKCYSFVSCKDDDEEWDDLDLRTASAIRLSLAKNVLANVHGISTAKELWEKLEQLYQGKGISNRFISRNSFILFPILMYGKETQKYADVTGKLLSEEKRLESSSHTSSSEGMFLVSGKGKKKFSQRLRYVGGVDNLGMSKEIVQVEQIR
ncbi:hypothetical protein LXL04_037408 [Taraxacum kok-saghyz]